MGVTCFSGDNVLPNQCSVCQNRARRRIEPHRHERKISESLDRVAGLNGDLIVLPGPRFYQFSNLAERTHRQSDITKEL